MKADSPRTKRDLLPLALFFLSGFTGLFLEVLWMRTLRLLLGSAAQSVAITLAVFFLGIAWGSRWWGMRAARSQNGLRLYGLLEIAVAFSSLLLLGMIPLFQVIHPLLVSGSESLDGAGMVAVKVVLSVGFLFPPCFFMGGTYPVMVQALVRSRVDLGTGGSLLYGVNTLGGAVGALTAGCFAIGTFGFAYSYLFAVVLAGLVGLAAMWISRSAMEAPHRGEALDEPLLRISKNPDPAQLGWGSLRLLAAGSGACTLALEVLWTRMFEQVLHNSVYTFSLILSTFLIALGLGGLAARRLAEETAPPSQVLIGLSCAAGLAAGLTPFLFDSATDGLSYLGSREGWWGYVGLVFGMLVITVLVPGILMGAIFPYLLKTSEPHSRGAGRTVGELASLNTLGAAFGSFAGAFLLLEWIGLWNGIRAVSAVYFWMALTIGVKSATGNRMGVVAPVGGLACLVFVLDPSSIPILKVSSDKKILETWEGSAGTVAVVESSRTRSILLNNHYTLGGLLARRYQETMSHIPLLAHPDPKSVFYLGMGTGITAGGAMVHPVERVTLTELIPDAVEAAQRYFQDASYGLFQDPRVEIVTEDGRLYLSVTDQKFDVIVADLFIPWLAGAGNLYSLEHYQNAEERLNPGGVYAQWIPLYQVSSRELGIIARTMIEVFPHLTLWRGDFFRNRSILLLMGHHSAIPFDFGHVERRASELKDKTASPIFEDSAEFWEHYLGSASRGDSPFDSHPINRDRRPIIEYSAPITMRQERAGEVTFVRGEEFLDLMEQLTASDRLALDPFLSGASASVRDSVREGFEKHRAAILRR